MGEPINREPTNSREPEEPVQYRWGVREDIPVNDEGKVRVRQVTQICTETQTRYTYGGETVVIWKRKCEPILNARYFAEKPSSGDHDE